VCAGTGVLVRPGRYPVSTSGAAPTIRFRGSGDFSGDIRACVAKLDGADRRHHATIYLKTAIISIWAIASWWLLVFWASNLWTGAVLAVSLGFAIAGIGFNVTHDANHGSFSPSRRVNRVMGYSLDVIGASSYVWRVKHNVIHHTFTNVSGVDSDIGQLPFLRLAPDQRRWWFHRAQHIYVWPLYGLFAVKWQLVGDITYLAMGKIEGTPFARPRGRDLVGFVLGKAIFLAWAIVIPLVVRPFGAALFGFVIASFVMAFTVAITFQLAHCVEDAAVMSSSEMAESEPVEWARHQLAVTANFATENRVLSWYLGGLNHQIEHHLFSRVCHVHYPTLSVEVQKVCDRYEITYHRHSTAWSALRSHSRWLREMGHRAVEQPAGA